MNLNSILFVLCFMVFSCEPVYRADIVNKSNSNGIIEIYFDSTTLKEFWDGNDYQGFLANYPNVFGVSSFDYDSIELKASYNLGPYSSFPLEAGIGNAPTYILFDKIVIALTDTIIELDNRDSIQNAFLKIDKRTWEYCLE